MSLPIGYRVSEGGKGTTLTLALSCHGALTAHRGRGDWTPPQIHARGVRLRRTFSIFDLVGPWHDGEMGVG